MPQPRNDRWSLRSASSTAAGPVLFLLIWAAPRPAGLSVEGGETLAVAAWMATWWLTIAVPLAVTALLPLVLFPLMGIASPAAAAAPYANPVIFLFMGGFFIAGAMRRWVLHRRVALAVVARTGTSPRRLVAGFMLASAFLSMWMSNTAATLMMMPIGVAVLGLVEGDGSGGSDRGGATDPSGVDASRRLGTALMLGIAYAGSIGGVATLIGTPPNAVLAGMADELLGREVSFARWMIVGVPTAVVMLIVGWGLLARVLYRLDAQPLAGARAVLEAERAKLGPWGAGERATAIVFGLTALAWIFRAPKTIGGVTFPGIQTVLPQVGDATVAMAGALALFLCPVRDADGNVTRVLDWETARSIPWDILILFGGGLSLASGFEATGLTKWLGGKLIIFSGLPDILVIGAVATLFVLLTEVTSNTATATLGLPVVAALAPGVGVDALPLMITAALGASMAFMLPVATPPNAIVFGTGRVEAAEMRRAGLWLNLVAVVVITALVGLVHRWIA